MAAEIKLFPVMDEGRLLTYYAGGSDVDASNFVIPPITAGDSLPLKVLPLIRAGKSNGRPLFSKLTGFTLGVSIGVRGASPDCYQNTWSTDGDFLSGSLDCNQAAFTTHVTAGTPVYFGIKVNDREVFQQLLTARLPTIAVGASVPAPVDDYRTKAEADQLYAKKDGANGDTIFLRSPGGIYGVILGVNDDGTLRSDIVTL